MDNNLKQQIDDMSYEDMLKQWRFASSGDKMFIGETGNYFTKKMQEKRSQITDAQHVAASKRIGW